MTEPWVVHLNTGVAASSRGVARDASARARVRGLNIDEEEELSTVAEVLCSSTGCRSTFEVGLEGVCGMGAVPKAFGLRDG